MNRKSEIRSRLAQMEELVGVLPTRFEASEGMGRVASSLKESDVETALTASRQQLEMVTIDTPVKDTAPELYEDPALREQMAGFAAAGVNFFHSDEAFWQMSPAERGARGGNGIVNRVFVENQRVMLVTSRIVIRLEEDVSDAARDAVLVRHPVTILGRNGLPPRSFRADVQGTNALEACLALMAEKEIEYAEPDFVEHIGPRLTPSDPEFGQQWHHGNIRAEAAWDETQVAGVRIAVIDNGFDITHPDLRFGDASGWFRSTADFVDADFVLGTANMPNGNHGTACAGMIAAIANNDSGGCGVAYGADLSMVACLPDQIGTQATLARAIGYAADPSLEGRTEEGADIVACSLGPNSAVWTMSAVLDDAIDFAATKGGGGSGCAIFWGCTNGNHPIESDQVCSHPQVMAIGRSTHSDSDHGSGFGPKLEFLAPGVDVWIPASGGGYHTTTGTSFAAPCAAGIGALALSKKPDMTAGELRQLLRDTCDKVGPLSYIEGHNIRFGHGRANAETAVSEATRLATGV
ncbi:S8 family serine peptidase [Rhodobium gokarnense]|uniref:Thermitase n=1 Tax=Rhodobium gokarnense TaxID=364296 RepID=A0ABT3HER1_9HYPH|nr:S8 family serine peptidase [Rhodobium gokarnense]MCW2308888.1 thermitase [Rhodobium gokarnense]